MTGCRWGEATTRLWGCGGMTRDPDVWVGWGRGVRAPTLTAVFSALQENGHVKSNGDLSPKGEGESPPVNGTEEAAGATGDAIEPAPPGQGAEAKGEVPPKETPKKKKKFSFKKPFKLSGLSFKRNRKEGGGDSSASSPTEEEQEQGEISACGEEGTAQEGKAAAPPRARSPRPKGQRPALPPREETQKRQGPRPQSHPLPRGQRVTLHQPASRMSSWVGAGG